MHRGGTVGRGRRVRGGEPNPACIHEYTVFSRVFSHGSNTRVIRVNTYLKYVFPLQVQNTEAWNVFRERSEHGVSAVRSILGVTWATHRPHHTHGTPPTRRHRETSAVPSVLADGERPKSWARRAGGRSSSAAARGEPALALRDARKDVYVCCCCCCVYVCIHTYIQSSPYFDPTHTRTGWIGQPPILNRHEVVTIDGDVDV